MQLAQHFFLTFLAKFLLIMSLKSEIPSTLWDNWSYHVLDSTVGETELNDLQMSFCLVLLTTLKLVILFHFTNEKVLAKSTLVLNCGTRI
jgi:hypothetical protein